MAKHRIQSATEMREAAVSERRGRTRERILEAALELVGCETGLHVRIEEVCAKAGVSRGTFYNYFVSLDELYGALWSALCSEQNQWIATKLGEVTSASVRVCAIIISVLERARLDTRWGWAMVNLAACGLAFGGDDFSSSRALFQDGVERGEFDIPDAQAGRDIVYGACLVSMATILREMAPRDFPTMIAHMALKSLGVAGRRIDEILSAEGRDIAASTSSVNRVAFVDGP